MAVLWRLALASLAFGAFGFQMPGLEDKIPDNVLIRKNPVALSDSLLAKARDNFADNCLPCHGAEGKGDGPLATSLATRPKDLTNARELAEMTDGEIFWTITKGRRPMPAFDQKLMDDERWGLVHLVRGISHTRPNTTPKAAAGGSAKPQPQRVAPASAGAATDGKKK